LIASGKGSSAGGVVAAEPDAAGLSVFGELVDDATASLLEAEVVASSSGDSISALATADGESSSLVDWVEPESGDSS